MQLRKGVPMEIRQVEIVVTWHEQPLTKQDIRRDETRVIFIQPAKIAQLKKDDQGIVGELLREGK